jgi:hypothetical protein
LCFYNPLISHFYVQRWERLVPYSGKARPLGTVAES